VRVGKIALIKHQRYAHAKAIQAGQPAAQAAAHHAGAVIRDITRSSRGGRR